MRMFRYHWRCANLGWCRMWTNLWMSILEWIRMLTELRAHLKCGLCSKLCTTGCVQMHTIEHIWVILACTCTYILNYSKHPNVLNFEQVLCASSALAWSSESHLMKGPLLCGQILNTFFSKLFHKSGIFSLQNILTIDQTWSEACEGGQRWGWWCR